MSYHLAAPSASSRDANTGQYSWRVNNTSTYLWDKGLWSACVESREAILEHFNFKMWNETRLKYLVGLESHPELKHSLIEQKCIDMEPTVAFGQEQSELFHIMVRPSRDLFILDVPDLCQNVNLHHLLSYTKYPAWDSRSRRDSRGMIQNIAVEFSPSWMAELDRAHDANGHFSLAIEYDKRNPTFGVFVRLIRSSTENYNNIHGGYCRMPFIWLIDPQVKLYAADKNKPLLPAFCDLNETKYVETDCALHGPSWRIHEDYDKSAVCFLERFRPDIERDLTGTMDFLQIAFGQEPGRSPYRLHRHVGVLTVQ